MTDKFLGTGSVGGNISNGTISIYGSKIGAKNLDPSRAVKTDSQGRLQTTDLDIADVNNLTSILESVLTNPYTPPIGEKFTVIGNMECTDIFTTSSIVDALGTASINLNEGGILISSEANDLLFNSRPIITTPYTTGIVELTSIATNSIYDESKNAYIEFNPTTINVVSTDFTFNGEPVSQLDRIIPLETKTQHINADANFTTITGEALVSSQIRTGLISDMIGDGSSISLSETAISLYVPTLNPILTLNNNRVITNDYDGNVLIAGSLTSSGFVKIGGTNQQYLMADGNTLTQSANSGNSNYYLYNSVTSQSTTPGLGNISYNNVAQEDATEIYISHRTRDNIDIEVFFKQISILTDVYLQDQQTSVNFIQFNIVGTPTIVAESQVSIPVVISNSGGTGSSSFGNGHNILCAFFTNTLETDTRISNIEFKTQYILSVFGNLTNFGGTVTAGTFEATNIKKIGGTSTQFLKANGTIDSNTYLNVLGGEVAGDLIVNNIIKKSIANIDFGGNIDRPYMGLQFVHNLFSTAPLSNLAFTGVGTITSSGFSSLTNITRQLCCVTTSPSVNSDGSAGGYISTSSSGGQTSMGSSFGLYASFAITDTGINLNNCQNFIGLYNSYNQINLNQSNQLSTYRNIIAFGSDTDDTNICIYTASSTATFKQVDLGASFPASVQISGGSNWYKLALWWDSNVNIIFYKCVNTTLNSTVSGSFVPALNAYPADSVNLTPQILRVQGSPQASGSGKLRIQRFGLF